MCEKISPFLQELRAPTHFFIANLSLADFLVGIMAMPFLATVHVTDRWYFGSGFCYAWVIIHFWLCSASILSTLAVCVERYVGVKYPLRHVEIMSVPRSVERQIKDIHIFKKCDQNDKF